MVRKYVRRRRVIDVATPTTDNRPRAVPLKAVRDPGIETLIRYQRCGGGVRILRKKVSN